MSLRSDAADGADAGWGASSDAKKSAEGSARNSPAGIILGEATMRTRFQTVGKTSLSTGPTADRHLTTPLAKLPASLFGIVLGIAGLANAWRAASRLWGSPVIVGEALFGLAAVVFVVLASLFALKWIVAVEAARVEAEHPVQCCFIGLGGVAALLIAQGALPYDRAVATVLFTAGAFYVLAFGLWRTGLLWRGGRSPDATTPVLYLPTVAGGFVAGTTAAALGWPDWGRLAFGGAFFSWLAIESVLLHRLYTAPELTPPLRPVLGIQIAPPAVGAVSYLAVSGGRPDMLVEALVGYALLQALLVARMARWIAAQPFAPSYWSFAFGLTALAAALIRLATQDAGDAIRSLAGPAFVAANVLVFAVAVRTIAFWVRPVRGAQTATGEGLASPGILANSP